MSDGDAEEPAVTETPFEIALVGGVPFHATTFAEAVSWVAGAAQAHRAVNVRLANAWNVALADKDLSYRDLLTNHGVNLPDGTPVAWIMNVGRGSRAKADRIRGPSLFQAVLHIGVDRGIRHFFLGGTPGTLARLQTSLERQHPGLEIAGTYSPPFSQVDDTYIADCARHVGCAGADIVWVGLGTPKQDLVGTALAGVLGIATVNVGAAFDFAAGTVAEAPRWIQRSGFEWLFRLLTEPRRLWRRYLVGNLEFLWAAGRLWKSDKKV